MIYLSSDSHFGHERIKEFCGRPDNFEELIHREYQKLTEDDLLIHLGDICWGNSAEHHKKYIEPIKATKVLVKGNHDEKSYNWYLTHGWDFVCESFKWDYMGKRIVFSHQPVGWDGDWELNVCGHFHNLIPKSHEIKTHMDFMRIVSLENSNYKLINLQSFLSKGGK